MRLKDEYSHAITIDKSEFICYLKKVFNEQEAREHIESIRKKHRDATHCCTAFVCGERNDIQRTNDDGEPSGTAGKPMLDALQKNNLTNCCACVVRYYGGIQLGASGLIRAYSKSVSETILRAPKVETVLVDRYTCSFSYDWANKLDFFMKETCDILDKSYDVDVTYTFQTTDLDYSSKLIEFSKGQIMPKHIEQCLIERDIPNK